MTALTQHTRGLHNRWCQKRKDGAVYCKFTGEQIKLVVK